MPRKTQKKKSGVAKSARRVGKSTVARVRKAGATAGRKTAASVKKAAKGTAKKAGGAAKSIKKAAANPRRTVRQAATNVHETARRARDVGETVTTAGEVLTQAADWVDSMAMRAKARTKSGRKRR